MSGEMRLILGFNAELSFFLPLPCQLLPPLPPVCRFWPSAAATFSCTFFEHLSGCGSLLPLSFRSPLPTSLQLSALRVFNFLFWGLWKVFWPAFAQVSWWIGQKILWVHLISCSSPYPSGALTNNLVKNRAWEVKKTITANRLKRRL